MHIRYGYALTVDANTTGSVLLRVDIHPDERSEITQPDNIEIRDAAGNAVDPGQLKQDRYGNIERQVALPPGRFTLEAQGTAFHSGFAEASVRIFSPSTTDDTRAFLSNSPFCDLENLALPAELLRHNAITPEAILAYLRSTALPTDTRTEPTKNASETLSSRLGSEIDDIHLAIALCRKVGFPARLCRGYRCGEHERRYSALGAWFEVWGSESWHPFDRRPEGNDIGRLTVARGLDASDTETVKISAGMRIQAMRFVSESVTGARFPLTSLERREHWRDRQLFRKPS